MNKPVLSAHPSLLGELKLCTEIGPSLSDIRIQLLEAIADYGSMAQAAKAIQMSYRAAWNAIDEMNNLAETPLVLRSVGGKHGGGTQLTDYGRQTIALYRMLQEQYQQALLSLQQKISPHCRHSDKVYDVAQFRQLLHRISIRSSARNQFIGSVSAIKHGVVDSEITLKINDDLSLFAMITRESAENLDIDSGMELYAFIKSSAMILVGERNLILSPRNQLWGTVERILEGPVNTEVILTLAAGKTVCAVITTESATAMQLHVGQELGAVFDASAVMLCRYL